MFNRKTLVVLGAGASRESGIPIGSDLANRISTKLDIRFDGSQHVGKGDLTLYADFKQAFQKDARQYQHAAWAIRDGIPLSDSIDDFLDLHKHNDKMMLYGKAAIVKCILEAERKSTLWFDPNQYQTNIDFVKNSDTWFVKFMKMASRGIHFPDVNRILNNLSFIVFNYDRCLEHFLYNAIWRQYGIPAAQAADIVRAATIIHPFGAVGTLRFPGERDGIPFGSEVDYISTSQNIKTYTDSSVQVDDMRAEMRAAQCVIFLGCAFHEPNMRLFDRHYKPRPVYATAFEMSNEDAEVAQRRIRSLFMTSPMDAIIVRNDLTCGKLFSHFSKSLAG